MDQVISIVDHSILRLKPLSSVVAFGYVPKALYYCDYRSSLAGPGIRYSLTLNLCNQLHTHSLTPVLIPRPETVCATQIPSRTRLRVQCHVL